MSNASITLTRARKALTFLTHEMDDSSYITNTSIDFHLTEDQACEAFEANQLEGSVAVQKQLATIRAVYELRSLISEANHSNGIEALMNNQRRLMKEESVFQNVVSRRLKTLNTVEEFKSKFAYEIAQPNNGYSHNNGVICTSISQQCAELCASEAKSVKKQLMNIEDQLAQLNNSVTIIVKDATHQILLDHDLI